MLYARHTWAGWRSLASTAVNTGFALLSRPHLLAYLYRHAHRCWVGHYRAFDYCVLITHGNTTVKRRNVQKQRETKTCHCVQSAPSPKNFSGLCNVYKSAFEIHAAAFSVLISQTLQGECWRLHWTNATLNFFRVDTRVSDRTDLISASNLAVA